MLAGYLPVLILAIIAVLFAAVTLFVSNFIGHKKPSEDKLLPYECGNVPVGTARERFPVRFYIYAMLFIVFDVEVAFMFPWAVLFKGLGLLGLIEMAVFVLILLLGLLYVWGKGALEWE
ncbi:MAG: NADH-quinone oxidoreductase subunit A [Deltaproteobacteria bacterium]|nr:NADH-quinone oxidoreductase subunit A [Deltaproteobacteria bacterium]MBW2067874.1 NADH-quinone oxidoreductase subunit A [Deltaproteobacteria bacterium]